MRKLRIKASSVFGAVSTPPRALDQSVSIAPPITLGGVYLNVISIYVMTFCAGLAGPERPCTYATRIRPHQVQNFKQGFEDVDHTTTTSYPQRPWPSRDCNDHAFWRVHSAAIKLIRSRLSSAFIRRHGPRPPGACYFFRPTGLRLLTPY